MSSNYYEMPHKQYPQSLFNFINSNLKEDSTRLRLKYHSLTDGEFDYDFAIDQIECRKKHRKKLHHFFSNPLTLVSTTLSAEQASHEAVARFHASLVSEDENILDMTAGLGIDSMAMAAECSSLTAFEYDPAKAEILRYNADILGIGNLSVECGDSSLLPAEHISRFDVVFVDPARRGKGNQRLYNLHDCQPDILSLIPRIHEAGARLIIKASPLLDIRQTIRDVEGITSVRCISVEGECKEVLVVAEKDGSLNLLEAVNLSAEGDFISRFAFHPEDEDTPFAYASANDLERCRYLYEPEASLMKLAPWGAIQRRFQNMLKLAPSSHLFISDEFHADFPGRITRIKSIIDKKGRKSLKGFPANVVCRNYPLSATQLRTQLGIAEGKDSFVYASRIGDKPVMLLTERIIRSGSLPTESLDCC